MSFYFSAAPSSRITKPKAKKPLTASGAKRTATAHKKKKPGVGIDAVDTENDEENDDLFTEKLEDLGLITTLATEHRFEDVIQQLKYVQDHMFDDIPVRSGLNSARLAEVLNFRKNLPPIVTIPHIHALSRSPTAAEREIAALTQQGVIRRIVIPGRGLGSSAIGESVVLSDSWVDMVHQSTHIEASLRNKYVSLLKANPTSNAVPAGGFTPSEAISLIKAGFLTSTSMVGSVLPSALSFSNRSGHGTLASLSSAGSRAATGSMAAVGGESAFLDAGGGGSSGLSSLHFGADSARSGSGAGAYTFSLPSIGPYLKLLESSRSHLTHLLARSKYKEIPKDLLRERWDGFPSAGQRRAKGLAGAILPARTRKWKQFYGLRFQWVLEECLGTGLIEVFDTGSVGHGVRLA